MQRDLRLEDCFFGSATVGERGQIVIPSNARKQFGINPGDKMLVLGHPAGNGVMLCKIDAMRDFLSSFFQNLEQLEASVLTAEMAENGE